MVEKVKILIVDDEKNARVTLVDILKEEGFLPIEAASGEDAIAIAQKERPAIVLIDTILPGINGHETCRRIKAIEGLNTKVISVTGKIDAVDAGEARKAGADDYHVKVSDCTDLIAAIKALINEN